MKTLLGVRLAISAVNADPFGGEISASTFDIRLYRDSVPPGRSQLVVALEPVCDSNSARGEPEDAP